MKIAILTSGGDCSGMNPGIKAFAEHSLELGLQPYGIYEGLEGLIDGRIETLSRRTVSGIIHCGGTVLRSSRSARFRQSEGRQLAAEQLRAHGIGHVVLLGGDGSRRALQRLNKESGIKVACVPATIDNDIAGTDYCIGVDSALNVIRGAIDGIRDTAASLRRAFVIETMGRSCGYLAIVSAITSGAEICLTPELDFDPAGVRARLLNDIRDGRRYAIAVVAEAVQNGTQTVVDLFEKEIGLDCRVTVLGHVQRGGSPSVFDRRVAAQFVTAAVDGLKNGREAFAVGRTNGTVRLSDFDASPPPYQIDPALLSVASKLAH